MPPVNDPPNNLCPECGKKPGKPKFCSQSCAAKYNNRRSPKRQPEGKCDDCGAAIPTKQKRCAVCAAKSAEAKRRIAENIQSFRTPDGEIRELSVQKAWVHNAMVFEPHPHGSRRFNTADPCGDFLDALLGVVFARPAYIRPGDIHRYAAWIDAFRSHVIDHPWGTRRGSQFPVVTIQLRDLGFALRDWVDTVMRTDNHTLFPTLAVDAARFIEGHAFGHSGSGRDSWRITGLVTQALNDEWAMRDRLTDPRLKHEITSRLKGTLTRCVVPFGSNIPSETVAQPLLGQDEPFIFEVERCHLTQENYYDHPCLRAVEDEVPKFDIADDLWFRGAILIDPTTSRPITCLATADSSWQWNRRGIPSEIPVRWISDVYERSEDSRALRPVPIPQWTV